MPGLAKTLAVKTLGQVLDLHFARIQFTPDLLPADLMGTLIYQQKTGEFVARKGPVFANLLLADEINRAPAKVQSALLESMQERQVTLGDTTHPLPEPFLVFATQNPIEQEGTYPLPEAQVDRFLLKVRVDYPTKEEERQILDRMMSGEMPQVAQGPDRRRGEAADRTGARGLRGRAPPRLHGGPGHRHPAAQGGRPLRSGPLWPSGPLRGPPWPSPRPAGPSPSCAAEAMWCPRM